MKTVDAQIVEAYHCKRLFPDHAICPFRSAIALLHIIVTLEPRLMEYLLCILVPECKRTWQATYWVSVSAG